MEAATKLPDSKAGDNNDVCPWLTAPLDGRLLIEGRARLPEGYALPELQHGFALTWRKVGDLWHFRGERWGDLSDAYSALCLAWFDHHSMRVDRVTYDAPTELTDGESADFATLRVVDGEPVAVEANVPNGAEADLEHYFGDALKVGPWHPISNGCSRATYRAAVVEWIPNGLGRVGPFRRERLEGAR